MSAPLSLDALAKDPDRVESLALPVVCALVGQLAALQLRLTARMASAAGGPVRSDPRVDRLLTAKQVAARLERSANWVYAHSHELPFAMIEPRRRPRYSERGLEQWIARHLQRGC